MAATAKVIELKGNPKTPESAEHIIIFPGGSLSVCRTSDNQYWAHVHVDKKVPGVDSIQGSKDGKIEVVRVDTPQGVKVIDHNNTDHFAVLISTK